MTKPALYEPFAASLELGLRLLDRLPSTHDKMLQSLPGDLRAAAYDTESRGTSAWCDVHEQAITTCHKQFQTGSLEAICVGIPLPKVTDPTGDAALERLWGDRRDLVASIKRITHEMRTIERVILYYDVNDETPDERDERDRKNSTVWCEIHHRYGFEVEADTGVQGSRVPVEGRYVLKDPKRMCQWCRKTTKLLGRLPNQQEVTDNALGKRLKVRVA